MMTVFWDMKGPLLIHYTPKGQTVNSDSYCELLRDLKPKIKTKRRGKLSKGVLLLQDNARPHTAGKTIQCIQDLGFELLEHPPYSPDLAPSDFHLFGPMKEHLRESKFSSDDEVVEAVREWLCTMPQIFFQDGITKLVKRWTKCIEVEGDYVEK